MNKREEKQLREELEFYRRNTKLSLCKICRKPIISDQNKVTTVLRIRNKEIKSAW